MEDAVDLRPYIEASIVAGMRRAVERDHHRLVFHEDPWTDPMGMEMVEYGAVLEWDRLSTYEVTIEEETVTFGRARPQLGEPYPFSEPGHWATLYPQVWIHETPVGEDEVTPVRLDECWRCSVTIPKEDPLGLCDPCRVQLRNL